MATVELQLSKSSWRNGRFRSPWRQCVMRRVVGPCASSHLGALDC
ncbi:RUVBL2 isoform 5 [Pan troglodytes]|uniref:RuvB like AAA ATPase 2 n=2 Tax=Homininae TaxID=207598 RepID=M0QYD8_HUMAN|nr:RuvB-like 2 (E. coli), isoform CRA_c [Homo sapiens]PNI29193.1 RUVBL2 isoform 5 [Pan troglodytes]